MRCKEKKMRKLPHWIWKTRYYIQAVVCNKVIDTRMTEGEVGAMREAAMMEKKYYLSKIEVQRRRVRVMEMREYRPEDL